jgi:hypothetical protein
MIFKWHKCFTQIEKLILKDLSMILGGVSADLADARWADV